MVRFRSASECIGEWEDTANERKLCAKRPTELKTAIIWDAKTLCEYTRSDTWTVTEEVPPSIVPVTLPPFSSSKLLSSVQISLAIRASFALTLRLSRTRMILQHFRKR